MANCPKCGAFLKEGQKFCTKCGTKIELIPPEISARIDIMKKKIEKDSLNPQLYIELGDIYKQNNLLQEALIEYQKALNINDSYFDAHLKSGEIYLKLKEFGKAETSYQKALSLNPKSLEAKVGLLRSFYYSQRRIEDAINLGEEIVRAERNNLEVHKTLKELYDKKGMKEKVFEQLKTITLLAPNDKNSLKELANLYEERGDVDKAFELYQKVLQFDPEDTETHFRIGRYFLVKGDYQNVIKHLQNIVEKLPVLLKSYAHLYLALAYINRQELDNAMKETRLVSISPSDYKELTARDKKFFAEAYYKIGSSLFQRKNFAGAVDYLERAIKYEPENYQYKKLLDTVKAEVEKSKTQAKRKVIKMVVSVAVLAVIIMAGWCLSHGKVCVYIIPEEEAKVYIDSKLLSGKWAKPGVIISPSLFFSKHKITVEKDGYEKWEGTVKVGLGKTTKIEAKLIPIYGSLKINSEPLGADVYLDGKLIGKTPLLVNNILSLSTPYNLEIKSPLYKPYTCNVTIRRDDTLNLELIRLINLTGEWKGKVGGSQLMMSIKQTGEHLETYFTCRLSWQKFEGKISGTIFDKNNFFVDGRINYYYEEMSHGEWVWEYINPVSVILEGIISQNWDRIFGKGKIMGSPFDYNGWSFEWWAERQQESADREKISRPESVPSSDLLHKEIQSKISGDITISSIDISQSSITVIGLAPTNLSVANYMNRLEESPHIRNVDLTSLEKKTIEGKEMVQFTLKANKE